MKGKNDKNLIYNIFNNNDWSVNCFVDNNLRTTFLWSYWNIILFVDYFYCFKKVNIKMIHFTGDTHGEWGKLQTYKTKTTKDDVVIVLGDFGLAWNPTTFQSGIRFFEKIPATVIAVKGNHENYDDIAKMKVVEKFGAKMHKCSDNVFYVCNGEVMTIEEKTFYVFGGGKSIDKDYRLKLEAEKKQKRTVHWKLWWAEELPSKEEFEYGVKQFEAHRDNLNFILTHEAPNSVMRGLNFDLSYPEFVDFWNYLDINRRAETKWLFGHLHIDRSFGDNLYGFFHSKAATDYFEKS